MIYNFYKNQRKNKRNFLKNKKQKTKKKKGNQAIKVGGKTTTFTVDIVEAM